MKELLNFIIEGILGSKDFEITEKEEDGQYILQIQVKPEEAGLIIGKGGQTIKSIQNIMRVKARKENRSVFVKVA